MFWRTVVRDSDDNTRITNQGRWARTVDMVDGTFRMLATGASWSGHERNHLFFGGLPGHQFERLTGISGLDDPGDSRDEFIKITQELPIEGNITVDCRNYDLIAAEPVNA